MLTHAVSAPDLARSVIAVPPLARRAEFSPYPAALAAAAASKAA